MNNHRWSINDNDRTLAGELLTFIPQTLYDMHAHVYTAEALSLPSGPSHYPQAADIPMLRDMYERVFDGPKLAGGLVMAYPADRRYKALQNEHVAQETAGREGFKGSILVAPEDTYEVTCEFLDRHPQIIGLKPYFWYSGCLQARDSAIQSYLPQWCWRLADERNLAITLHLVRERALSDDSNLSHIRHMCGSYPRARLILAHTGGCFHAPHAQKGAQVLRGLSNIWFDVSAICEPEPIMHILREFGPERLLWGSDFPECMLRGRVVTAGLDSFWLQDDATRQDTLKTSCRLVWIILESIRALKTACGWERLCRADIESVFADNAKYLLGLIDKSCPMLRGDKRQNVK